jgi:hypothetical protein
MENIVRSGISAVRSGISAKGGFWRFGRKFPIVSCNVHTSSIYSGLKLTANKGVEWRSSSPPTIRRLLSTGASQTGTGTGSALASTTDEFVSDGPDDQSYMRGRWADLKHMQDLDNNFQLYPHNFRTTSTIPEFNTTYQYLGPGERRPETCVILAGRVNTIRRSGKSLVFLELKGDGAKVQVFLLVSAPS